MIFEKVARGRGDPVAESSRGDMFLRNRFDRREVKGNALKMGMFPRRLNAEQASGSTYIANRIEARKIEFVRERFEVNPRKPRHRAEKLLKPGQF